MSVPDGQGESGPALEPRISAESVRTFEAFGDTWARIPRLNALGESRVADAFHALAELPAGDERTLAVRLLALSCGRTSGGPRHGLTGVDVRGWDPPGTQMGPRPHDSAITCALA